MEPGPKAAEGADLETLSELHAKIQIRQAHLAVSKAEFDLALVKLFVKHGLSTQTHALCLLCGSFNVQGVACLCGSVGP